MIKKIILLAQKMSHAKSSAICGTDRRAFGHDFGAQKSLLQEIIEAAGHLCIFLPKFHCKLNFIEFFWGVVKCYLCENCDYTFATLKGQ